MTERVYPSAKPNPPPASASLSLRGGEAAKSQLYNPTRNLYRPTPKPPSRRRGCCVCCIWIVVSLLALLLLAAIAGAVFWVLYRPQSPSFSVSSLKLTSFNLTTTASASASPRIISRIEISIFARNPNKKIVFLYDQFSISASSSGNVDIGNGTLPPFFQGTKNTTVLRAVVSTGGARDLDSASASSLASDLKTNKNRLRMEIRMETKVRVKIGGMKSKKVEIQVVCSGIDANIPKGKSASTAAAASDVKCEFRKSLRIWKWNWRI